MVKHFCDACGDYINKLDMRKFQVELQIPKLANEYHSGSYTKEICDLCQAKLIAAVATVFPGFGAKVQ